MHMNEYEGLCFCWYGGSSVTDASFDAARRIAAVCHGILESMAASSRSRDASQGCDSMIAVINADFNLLKKGDIDFDLSGSILFSSDCENFESC